MTDPPDSDQEQPPDTGPWLSRIRTGLDRWADQVDADPPDLDQHPAAVAAATIRLRWLMPAAAVLVVSAGIWGVWSVTNNGSDAPLATSPPTSQTRVPAGDEDRTAAGGGSDPALSVQTIEIHTGLDGGEDVVFVFDGQLPDNRVTYAPNIKDFDAPGIAYAVQDPSEIWVCDDRHFDFGPGASAGSIDILIPSEWWTSGAPVHEVPTMYVPPLDSNRDSINSPGKIVGCGPYNGYIQYSIWAPASDDPDDIRVSVQDDSTRLVVAVRP